jgi:hypothetical protein
VSVPKDEKNVVKHHRRVLKQLEWRKKTELKCL